jgi:hypothetical protein
VKLIRRNPYSWTGWEFTFDVEFAIMRAVLWAAALFYMAIGIGVVLYWLGWWT